MVIFDLRVHIIALHVSDQQMWLLYSLYLPACREDLVPCGFLEKG